MSNWKKFIVGADIHGDMADASANKVFFDFAKDFNPDIRICAGDLWDFRPLRKGADEDERCESMAKDYNAGLLWLKKFQPNFFLRGNHDERLWELAASKNGVLSDYALSGVAEITNIVRAMKCSMLPYHKREGVLRLGSLKIIHGFFAGINAAKQHATFYGSCLYGHTHTIDDHPIGGLERRAARGIGCLCSLDMDYQARQPSSLRHAHGFAYGIVNTRTGKFHVWQAEEIDGVWAIPSDIVFYEGKK